MISFGLHCNDDHQFDGWFSSSSDFDEQSSRGLVECPVCGSKKISKALMAPSVSTGRQKDKIAVTTLDVARSQAIKELRKMRDKVLSNAEDVGNAFPEEARKIHYGETDARGIYGNATPDDAAELLDEGIEIAPIPQLPDDVN